MARKQLDTDVPEGLADLREFAEPKEIEELLRLLGVIAQRMAESKIAESTIAESKTPQGLPALLSFKQTEWQLSCSRATIYRFVQAGLLTAVGERRSRRITKASMEALVARIDAGEDIWAIVHAMYAKKGDLYG